MRYHCTPIGLAKIKKNLTKPIAGKEAEQQELSPVLSAGGNAKWYSHLEENLSNTDLAYDPATSFLGICSTILGYTLTQKSACE